MTTISAFKSATDTNPISAPLLLVFKGIESGKWKHLIEPLRELDKEAYTEAKKSLPAVTFSGTFSERKSDKLLDYSNLVVLDIDNLDADVLDRLAYNITEEEKCVVAQFISPSGKGMKIICIVNTGAEHHLSAFLHLQRYFQDKYLFKIDDSGKDLARLCFVSYDENIYINLEAEPFEVDTRYADVKTYTQDSKFLNYEPLKDHKELFKLIKYWVENGATPISYVEGSRNRYIHAFGCALNRVGLPLGDAITMLQSNYDLPTKELISTVRKSYFQNSDEHASVEVKDLKSTDYKAPAYIANYHEDVVENDLATKTALLYHKSVPMNDISDIIGKIAKYYDTKGYIDITKASLTELMNKSIQQLNNAVLEDSALHSLVYEDAADIGRRLVEMDLVEGTIATYLGDLDIDMNGGILPKSFVGIIGVGGTFKSILLQYICWANAANGIPCLYLNGEMADSTFFSRLGFMALAENLTHLIRTGKVNKENIEEYIERMNSQINHNLFVVNGNGFNQENVNATLDNIKSKHGKTIRLIGVDGVSQMASEGREEINAAIMNTGVCKEIAKTCNQGQGAVVLGLMHVSGEQVAAKIRRDNGPFCRGGGKTIANMDAYFSTSLLIDPDTDNLENDEDVIFIPNKFYIRLNDKRTATGFVSKIINVNEKTLHLSVEDCIPSDYERKLNRKQR